MNTMNNAVLDMVAKSIEHGMLCNVYVGGEQKAVGMPIDELRFQLAFHLLFLCKRPSKVAKMVIGIVEKQGSYHYGSLRVVAVDHPKHHAVRKVA